MFINNDTVDPVRKVLNNTLFLVKLFIMLNKRLVKLKTKVRSIDIIIFDILKTIIYMCLKNIFETRT